MKVLTVRQPWASAIIYGDKDIENRSWKPPKSLKAGDRLAIHAGKPQSTKEELEYLHTRNEFKWWLHRFDHGAIIGTVQYDGYNDGKLGVSDNQWAEPGMFWWYLSDPQPCKPVYCKGQLGLWTIDDNLIERI